MGAKINDVTNTDIEMLIKSGQDVASRANDFSDRIYHGQHEELDQPVRKAQDILTTSRSLADLATRILNRSILKETTKAYEKELKARHEKASGKTNVG